MPSHQERVRRNYPEGVPAFGASRAFRWDDWFTVAAHEATLRVYNAQTCVNLGHVYGHAGICLFCMAPKPAPDDTVTLTREELVEQLEEIASKNGMTAESMARLLRRRSCQGLGSWCQNSAEFCVVAHMLPTDDPLSVDVA